MRVWWKQGCGILAGNPRAVTVLAPRNAPTGIPLNSLQPIGPLGRKRRRGRRVLEQNMEEPTPTRASLVRSRSSAFESPADSGASLTSLLDEISTATTFDLGHASSSIQSQFITLSAAKKADVLSRLAAAPPSLTAINLAGLGLDNSHATALAAILRRPSLQNANFERNNLTEGGLLQLADALLEQLEGEEEQRALSEFSVANQRTALSTLAITRLLDAMQSNRGLIKLGLGSLRDDGARKRHQQVTMANTEAKRVRRQQQQQQQQASGGDTPSPLLSSKRTPSFSRGVTPGGSSGRVSSALLDRVASIESVVSGAIDEHLTTIDWSEEARRIAASEGCETGGDDKGTYSMTGNSQWLRATEDEKGLLIGAFGSNTHFTNVSFANSALGDSLGAIWGRVLAENQTITVLNLESNAISNNALEAIAAALRGGTKFSGAQAAISV